MAFYYVTIFEENGRYESKFDLNQAGQMNTFRMGMQLGATPIYHGEIQDEQQGKVVLKFVEEANKTRAFDKSKLEKLLEKAGGK